MKRILALILALLLLLTAAAGCTVREQPAEEPEATAEPAPTKKPEQPKPTPKPTPEPPEETEEPVPTEEPEPAYRNPLNGEPLEEPYMGRPVTVMINNLDKAMPHCGTANADILYEVLAEGGVTRMQAVFSDVSGVPKIGPVRSIRPYFLDIAISYGSVIGHAGGSDEAYSRIRNEALQNIDGVRGSYSFSVFYRDSSRMWKGAEHALFTTGDNLLKCAEEKKYPLSFDTPYESGLHFAKDAVPENGEDANAAEITFSMAKKTTLFYNENSGLYSMVQHRADYIDENTGDLVLFKNFIAIYTNSRTIDDYGRLSMDTTSGGRGYFACGGKFVPITWERDAGESFRYYLEDGSELQLGVGKTYIAVVPEGGQGSVLFS